jgi:hypothetical protein
MFFWVALSVMLVVAVGLIAYGLRGYSSRYHEPGTRHLD